ncbi:MAG: pyruvate kinase [Bacteroidota bacterium]|nr:pyruvate kinase [Bacteroidota bacterium]MDP3143982.1 pyruvate kinase [Bacteroidota bacterium]MDP3557519.1 pyruvate kinase [Bacteroidota bacterium]
MSHFNRTKIVATMGPATADINVLEGMFNQGLDICRINFSHGDYEAVLHTVKNIHELNKKLNRHVGILADLQGPKLRIGVMKDNSANLINGEIISITTKECEGDERQIYITYPQFPQDVNVGETVLIDDGKIHLKVIDTNGKDMVRCEILVGGILSSKKGVNLPNTKISLPCLTIKDIRDLEFALEHDFDWIGLSFVRSVTDIVELKDIIKHKGKRARVIAKIEKPEAINEIDNIIDVTDGIMVARGDLGVELPMEQVPLLQKMIVQKCVQVGKPVIIATQMMESMITSYTPTRAEVNDVANAVMDGADAVMLSAETSVGKYPVKVIEMMRRIITQVEELDSIYYKEHTPQIKTITYITDSICYNACSLAHHAGAQAIISMTNSGYTAFKLSSHRPKAHLFIFTDNQSLLTTLSLVWGIRGFYYNKYESTDETINDLKEFVKSRGFVHDDDLVINIASMPMKEKGRTNMMKLSYIN